MATRTILKPKDAANPVSYYSLGIRVGPVLYTSGQSARDQSGNIVSSDCSEQAQRAFQNLGMVLASGDMTSQDIVSLRILLRQGARLPDVLAVCDHFLISNRPALSIAYTTQLALPDYWLEVEAIAIAMESQE